MKEIIQKQQMYIFYKFFRIILITLFISSCSATLLSKSKTLSQIQSMSSSTLWIEQQNTQDSFQLAIIEAELGVRKETAISTSYLGKRSSAAFGKKLYSRKGITSNLRNCSNFNSTAEAQKFFLINGGPRLDPHNLDGDGDGLACEWGTDLRKISNKQIKTNQITTTRWKTKQCFTGPRGGTYTITASGNKNYSGC